MKRTTERRKSVRIPARLAMEVKLGARDTEQLVSVNVSANGVYFFSPVFIAPLTRVQITLVLPIAGKTDGGKSSKKNMDVSCEGVVVRTVPEVEQPGFNRYEIACYFTSVPDKGKEHLESYILNQIPL